MSSSRSALERHSSRHNEIVVGHGVVCDGDLVTGAKNQIGALRPAERDAADDEAGREHDLIETFMHAVGSELKRRRPPPGLRH
jgi:hypothetical protein